MRFFLALLFSLLAPLAASNEFITLASTTSTENSGLYDALLPAFKKATGIDVRVIAVGTGQALKIAERGDADALLVHHRPSEDRFIAQGFGIDRRDIMYNDFVILGPRHDPADIKHSKTALEAFRQIAELKPIFISRGDESGTHKKERELWGMAGITPQGEWYRDVGRGMGGALNIATAQEAYILSDRGTWLSFNNQKELTILFEGDPPLRNPYGLILVNPKRHPHVKYESALRFANWLTSQEGQAIIKNFRVENEPLFFPFNKN